MLSESLDLNVINFENIERKKINNYLKSWFAFSVIYLICVIIYSIIIFPNEQDRPKRDRLIATIDLIEFSDFDYEVEKIKAIIEDMIDRRVRKSEIYAFFEMSCKDLDFRAYIKKTNSMIKATFNNGSMLKFIDRNSSIKLIKREIPHSGLFTFFPSFRELHTIHKDIDYFEKATELQETYNFLDFSKIEKKYRESVKWLIPRFLLFAFLIWLIPVFLSFLAVCIKIRTFFSNTD